MIVYFSAAQNLATMIWILKFISISAYGKKSVTQGFKSQAQYIVVPLLRPGFQSFHSPDGIFLDKNQKLVVNENEGDSLNSR